MCIRDSPMPAARVKMAATEASRARFMSFLLINAIEFRLAGIQINWQDIDDAKKFSNS